MSQDLTPTSNFEDTPEKSGGRGGLSGKLRHPFAPFSNFQPTFPLSSYQQAIASKIHVSISCKVQQVQLSCGALFCAQHLGWRWLQIALLKQTNPSEGRSESLPSNWEQLAEQLLGEDTDQRKTPERISTRGESTPRGKANTADNDDPDKTLQGPAETEVLGTVTKPMSPTLDNAPTPPHTSDTESVTSSTANVRRCIKAQLSLEETVERNRERRRKEQREKGGLERDSRRNISPVGHDPPAQPPSAPLIPVASQTAVTDSQAPANPAPAMDVEDDGEHETFRSAASRTPSPGSETPGYNPYAVRESESAVEEPEKTAVGETVQPSKKQRKRGKKGGKAKRALEQTNAGGEGDERGPGITPAQVFVRPDPTASITITRQGEGGDAHNTAARALFVIRPVFDVLALRPITDGARIEVADRSAIDSIRTAMGPQGWRATVEQIWPRFHFIAPGQLAGYGPANPGLDASTIVRTLALRNTALWGLPADSVRYAGHTWEAAQGEGQGSTGTVRQRLRIWVDVSPECEDYLAQRGFYMTTLAGVVRLRSAPRRSGRS